jgi:hypothetical protein
MILSNRLKQNCVTHTIAKTMFLTHNLFRLTVNAKKVPWKMLFNNNLNSFNSYFQFDDLLNIFPLTAWGKFVNKNIISINLQIMHCLINLKPIDKKITIWYLNICFLYTWAVFSKTFLGTFLVLEVNHGKCYQLLIVIIFRRPRILIKNLWLLWSIILVGLQVITLSSIYCIKTKLKRLFLPQ